MFKKIILKEDSILKKLDSGKFYFTIMRHTLGDFAMYIEWINEKGRQEKEKFTAKTFLELLNKFNNWEMPDCLK
jgi:hypothetical protein